MALQGTGIIYAVNGAGNLYFYQDLARNGTPSWANSGNGQQIGNGWNFVHIFSSGDGIIYAVNGTGDLYFYRDLARNGTPSWANSGNGQQIGNGWNFVHIFSGGDGIIYAIDSAGDLYFYRDLARNGTVNWANGGTGQKIGNGWNFVHIFSGGDGIIYAIDSTGFLYFYRDLARNGTPSWANSGNGQIIGNGWNFTHVFSGGGGIIYAVDGVGDLYFYQDLARNGTPSWANSGNGQQIGNGWNFTHVFSDSEDVGSLTPIEGYCTPLSVAPGEQVQFRMSTGAHQYSVTYLRLKKLPGSDADGSVTAWAPFTVPGRLQPVPVNNPWETGCDWQADFSATIPSNLSSGLYAAKCVDANQNTFYVTFIVKPSPFAKKTLAVIANTNTWNAYNTWGGRSQYTSPNGVRLSFERPNPFATPNDGCNRAPTGGAPSCPNHLALAELWVLSWLEDEGYQFDVYSDLDFHLNPGQFASYKAIILHTHPEYWTMAMRNHIDQYLAQPNKKLVYLGGNGVFEAVNYNATNSQMIMRGDDPAAPRDPSFFRNLGRHERAFLGVAYETPNYFTFGPYEVLQAQHRFLSGTGLQNGNLIGSSGLNGGASGWEMDFAGGPGQVPNVQVLARGTNGADMTYYDTASGGFVFSVGSLSFGGSLAVDPALQKIVRNVLDECV